MCEQSVLPRSTTSEHIQCSWGSKPRSSLVHCTRYHWGHDAPGDVCVCVGGGFCGFWRPKLSIFKVPTYLGYNVGINTRGGRVAAKVCPRGCGFLWVLGTQISKCPHIPTVGFKVGLYLTLTPALLACCYSGTPCYSGTSCYSGAPVTMAPPYCSGTPITVVPPARVAPPVTGPPLISSSPSLCIYFWAWHCYWDQSNVECLRWWERDQLSPEPTFLCSERQSGSHRRGQQLYYFPWETVMLQ